MYVGILDTIWNKTKSQDLYHCTEEPMKREKAGGTKVEIRRSFLTLGMVRSGLVEGMNLSKALEKSVLFCS